MYNHTFAYTLQGVLECAVLLNRLEDIERRRMVLGSMVESIRKRGALPGRYSVQGLPDYGFTCVTGNCQLAIVLARAAHFLPHSRAYKEAFSMILDSVKRIHNLETNNPDIKGGVKGSDPVWGEYARFMYPNWAAKFFADALLIDLMGPEKSWG